MSDNTMTIARHRIYAPAKEGPFFCENCEFFLDGWCDNKNLVEVADDYGLKVKDGKARVEKKACCDFFKKYEM